MSDCSLDRSPMGAKSSKKSAKQLTKARTAQGERMKVAVIGPEGVGKSLLVWRLLHPAASSAQVAKQQHDIEPTIGAAFHSLEEGPPGARCRFDLWDTAGPDRYASLVPMYTRAASIILFCYDSASAKGCCANGAELSVALSRYLDAFIRSQDDDAAPICKLAVLGTKSEQLARLHQDGELADGQHRTRCLERAAEARAFAVSMGATMWREVSAVDGTGLTGILGSVAAGAPGSCIDELWSLDGAMPVAEEVAVVAVGGAMADNRAAAEEAAAALVADGGAAAASTVPPPSPPLTGAGAASGGSGGGGGSDSSCCSSRSSSSSSSSSDDGE